MTSDAALADAAASGDRHAFDQLCRRYRPELLGFVGRLVGDHHLAENIVLECFLVAWRDLPTLRDPAAVKRWLFSIAHRGAMRHVPRPPDGRTAFGLEPSTTVHSGRVLLKVAAVAALVAGMIAGTYAFAVDDPNPQTQIVNMPAPIAPALTSNTPSTTLSSSPSSSPPPSSARPAPVELSPEAQMVVLINQRRADAGCGPVRADERLALAAEGHSADMAAQAYFSHTSLDGSSPWDRAKRAGYQWPSAENIAAGNATADATMDQLMNSPGHRANILNCAHKAVGVGRATGGPYRYYWTQLFGSR